MTLEGYRLCWTVDDWVKALREADDAIWWGLDFETRPDVRREDTTSPLRAEDGANIAGIGLSWRRADGLMASAYCPIRHDRNFAGGRQPPSRQVLAALSDAISCRRSRPECLVVVANLAMELSFLLAENVCWPGEGQIHDIQIAARVLNKGVGYAELIGLKPLQAEILKRDMSSKDDVDRWLKDHRFKPGVDIWRCPPAIVGVYGQDDARDTLEIWERWADLVYRPPTKWWWSRKPNRMERHDLYEVEIEAGIQALRACLRGTRIDLGVCRRRANAATILQEACQRWIRNYIDMPTINPGSNKQMGGIIFTEAFGVNPQLEHMTDSFKSLPDRRQAAVISGKDDKNLRDYASLDADACKAYAKAHPEHGDFFLMLGAYKKCQTATTWFESNVDRYGTLNCADPWWIDEPYGFVHLIFHRLRTVGTKSGRMSSSDYNAQQVPKRFKMLLDADRILSLLAAFLSERQFEELSDAVDISPIKDGDESKATGIGAGCPAIDFSVRRMFIARPSMNMRLWDLSQVEMRGFAHFSGNKLLCGGYGVAIADEAIGDELQAIRRIGEGSDFFEELDRLGIDIHRHERADPFDIHQFVADEIDLARKPAKGINFGLVYGMGMKKLSRSLGWTPEQGRIYFAKYNGRFPEILEMQAMIKTMLRRRGYIFDPFGRRYYLPSSRAYVGLNRLIQGWAATVCKVGMVRTCELFESSAFGGLDVDIVTGRRTQDACMIRNAVHDEFIAELAQQFDDLRTDYCVRSCMTLFHGLNVPLGTSSERSHRSWDEAKEAKFAI